MNEATPNLANAEQLFAPCKRRYKLIKLPVAGHYVRIQSLTERETAAHSTQTLAKSGNYKLSKLEDAARRLIVMCMVDGAGNRILNYTHMEKIAEWDSADAAFLYKECAAHTGVNTEDIENLVKNSETITVEDSPLPSPSAPE